MYLTNRDLNSDTDDVLLQEYPTGKWMILRASELEMALLALINIEGQECTEIFM